MFERLKSIFKQLLFVTVLYSVIRLLFLINNWPQFAGESVSKILFAMVQGVRFDVAIIFLLNLPFILFWAVPLKIQRRPRWGEAVHVLFVLFNSAFLILNIADIELVNFNARRMTWGFFSLQKDVGNQLPQLMLYYWWWTLLCLALIPVFYFLAPRPRVSLRHRLREKLIVAVLGYLLGVFVLVLGIRGGWQNKPLREAHAFQASPWLGQLTLNTPFTVVHSRKKLRMKEVRFMDEKEAQERVRKDLGLSGDVRGTGRDNAVLIIVESLAHEYMGATNGKTGYTPFLDELARKSLLFTRHHANGRRSIEAMPALLAALPSLLPEPFLLSSYQAVQLRGLPQILRAHGYATAFFHGAENGSMFFDSFAARMGVQKYHGLSEYPEAKRDYDGFWGVLDEPFLQYFATELGKMPTPFFAGVFTLSSHQPYPVPEHLRGRFPKGELEIHESIGYADYALQQFFAAAEKQPWFENTLFIITGDHTQKSADSRYQDLLGPYRVPLLFYRKNAPWAGQRVDKITQHADMVSSVLDYLNIRGEKVLPFGRSVFAPGPGVFVARHSDVFLFHTENCTGQMTLDGQWLERAGCDEDQVRFFKAYVQSFVNGVIRNAFF